MEASNLQELKDAAAELMRFTCNSCERRFCEEDIEEEDGRSAPSPCSAIIRMRNALSANPIRNCDVGTPEEQTRRMFEQYCSEQISCYELPSGEHCPLYCEGVDCRLAWSNMPYTAQEGDAK